MPSSVSMSSVQCLVCGCRVSRGVVEGGKGDEAVWRRASSLGLFLDLVDGVGRVE